MKKKQNLEMSVTGSGPIYSLTMNLTAGGVMAILNALEKHGTPVAEDVRAFLQAAVNENAVLKKALE